MPVITLMSPDPSPGGDALSRLASAVTELLRLPAGQCWVLWQQQDLASVHRPQWRAGTGPHAPIGFVTCKQTYSAETVGRLLRLLEREIAELLGVPAGEVYLAVRRAVPGELLVRGEVWAGDPDTPTDVVARPIGHVVGGRTKVFDDNWDAESAVIRLDAAQYGPDAVAGLESFSHLEVIYHFHRVAPERIETGARHPRGNQDWPLVGIFAQRGKNRPNRLGVSRCRLTAVDGLDLHVRGLDAVEGSPVLDIKPYMAEFGPRGDVVQPGWSTEIMRAYY
jgi:tRNA-Thr(GGU) m(6)t(6)A37 methyltransferase TsaA